ncbi:MAG TPA: RNA methyltransferase [Actinomycetes bacterium]|nr:RNA methyltransferase [Actinomycetes bacterium]
MAQPREPIAVTSADDSRLADYRDLTDVALRRVREPAEGLFLAEGVSVVERALRAGYRPRSLLLLDARLAREDVRRVVADGLAAGAPAYVADATTLAVLTGYHVHRGVLAAFHRGPPREVAAVVRGGRRVAVLEDVVDHTNVGAAFRSAAALGLDAVLVTPRCADPLYRRAVRVSMGTVLDLPWARLASWPDTEVLREAGYVVAALTLDPDAMTLDELAARRDERLALVLGTEGDGLRPATVAAADLSVRIPMARGVDSLNVAAAAAVAFYATRPAAIPPTG